MRGREREGGRESLREGKKKTERNNLGAQARTRKPCKDETPTDTSTCKHKK